MPLIKNNTVLAIARDLKAFLKLEAGITRSGVVGAGEKPKEPNDSKVPGERLEEARRRLASKEREIERLRSGALGASSGVRAQDVVWIFGYGSGRCGTTWLHNMFRDLSGNSVWVAPMVGKLFGHFYYDRVIDNYIVTGMQRERKDYVLGANKDAWLGPMRDFILESIGARFPEFVSGEAGSKYLVVNEAHGSLGAPLIMEALSESRMVLLIRDPRDVIASLLEGRREGGWIHEDWKKRGAESGLADSDPDAFVKKYVQVNRESMDNARKAYESHEGPKTLITYEGLRAETFSTMKRTLTDLDIDFDEAELSRVVKQHSWENIPEGEKGQDKFYRKATPEGWREDLSIGQIRIVEEAFAPLIREFYPDRAN